MRMEENPLDDDVCAGMQPGDPGIPLRLSVDYDPTTASFASPDTDESGDILIIRTENLRIKFDLYAESDMHMWRADGTLAATIHVDTLALKAFGQPDGFVATSTTYQPDRVGVLKIQRDGQLIGGTPPPFATGLGSVYLTGSFRPGGGGMLGLNEGFSNMAVLAYGTDAQERWSWPVPDIYMARGVVGDRAVRTLVMLVSEFPIPGADPTLYGQWLDSDGRPVGGTFVLAEPIDGFNVARISPFERVGGGLFLQAESAWIGSLDSGSTTVQPAPVWLQVRTGKRFHMAYGGRAYAFYPASGVFQPNCDQQIEVVAPNGRSCGTASFHVDFTGPACTTDVFTLGYDGSVIQRVPAALDVCASERLCTSTWQVWPRFLGQRQN